jgi:hypothetical protein
MKTIFSELLEQKDGIYCRIKSVYDKPHNWLFVNLDTQKNVPATGIVLIKDGDNELNLN